MNRPVSVESIKTAAAAHFDVPVAALDTHRRFKPFVLPRHVAMYLACSLTPLSMTAIARCFRDRDHTTIFYAFRKVAALRSADREFDQRLNRLEQQLRPTEASAPEVQLALFIGPLFDSPFPSETPLLDLAA